MPKLGLGIVVACLFAATMLLAQPSTPTEPLPAPPTEERVLVQLAQMPVLARDRQGRPVVDLRADEITVELKGRRLRLAYFERMSKQAEAPKDLPDVRLYLDAPGGWSTPVRSNEGVPSYLAILVDNENDDPLRRQEALEKTLDFVRSSVPDGVRTSVLSYNGKLELELPFTTDKDAVVSAIGTASAREGRPRIDRQARIRQLLNRMEDCVVSGSDFGKTGDPRCIRDVANEYTGEVRPRADDFVQALDGLAEYLSGLRGSKFVFVMSHGVPVDQVPVILNAARGVFGNSDMISELQLYLGFGDPARVSLDGVLEKFVQRGIIVSFLDRTAPPTGDFQASRGQMLSAGTFPMRAEYDATVADMEQIAVTSGGIHVSSTDVTEGLKSLLDAKEAVYELGFYLDEFVDAERLAKVSIKTSRKGVKLTYRRGYYAASSPVEHSMAGRFAFTKGLPLEDPSRKGLHQPFALIVDPEAIGYDVGTVEARADFTVHLAVQSESGVQLAETYNFITHSYDLESWKAADRAPMALSGWIELPPGDFTLQAWIRNVRSGREGTVRRTVRVRETPLSPAESKPPGEG